MAIPNFAPGNGGRNPANEDWLSSLVGLTPAGASVEPRPDLGAVEIAIEVDGEVQCFLLAPDPVIDLAFRLLTAALAVRLEEDAP